MSQQAIIEQTVQAINRLPEDHAERVAAFVELIARLHEQQGSTGSEPPSIADLMLRLYEEQQFTKGIQQLTAENSAFAFLAEEEDLYTSADLKEKYSA